MRGTILTLAAAVVLVLASWNPSYACGGMPVVAPEPMPPSGGDSWSFLPEYQPGESVYEGVNEAQAENTDLQHTCTSDCKHGQGDMSSTVTFDANRGAADVFVNVTEKDANGNTTSKSKGLGDKSTIRAMEIGEATGVETEDVGAGNFQPQYDSFDAVVL